MLKWLAPFISLAGLYGLLGGCATSEQSIQDTSDTTPIDYRVESNQLNNTPAIDAPIDNRLDSSSSANSDSFDRSSGVGDLSEDVTSTIERIDDYRIGPDDLLDIQVFGVEELSQKVRVNSVGNISLPLIGEVQASGTLTQELEDIIEARLSKDYMQNPIVNVFIEEYASQRVTIGGSVGKPGVYALRGSTTLLQAVSMAGGLKRLALAEVNIFRVMPNNHRVKMTYNLDEIQEGVVEDPEVQGGDYLIVGTSEARKFLTDSLFRDITDFFNPFRFLQ
jgi:polysaccharide export outer membrane protein